MDQQVPGASSSDITTLPKMPMHEEVAREFYRELDVSLDPKARTYWCHMKPQGRPSFTLGLLKDLNVMQRSLHRMYVSSVRRGEAPMDYYVLGSRMPDIFNLGGDLGHFAERIRTGDRKSLEVYAKACIDVLYYNSVSFDLPVITIAMVQGDALGGGFEAALACDVIIAERSAKFGLPEVLFNLFPGMGAYSFLSRRLDAARAEKLIMSGRIYTAEELYEMGLVQVLAEDGKGRQAVNDYIRRNVRRHNSHSAIYRARRTVQPITYRELHDVVGVWVDAALNLGKQDLRKMERLMSAQDRRNGQPSVTDTSHRA
ncbi:crotonase/enoyl-CoA hydratase family protein [Breoghania sp. L-A4]|uniref:crotonase/enoyl-CoA hydratase family protein n=1 Tax=Breoghania sp. L-A4 TaxID=2304600 RepID=UPI000E35F859|nr:crotonase/enoyl-CoA hydratase family protein [Breoghania sp. L-A4]AXS38785.1 enoyl-CoA hydratase [Breoghania sp. L-A4]